MQRIVSSDRDTVSYEKCGNGPPLVLEHGSFSIHDTNRRFVKPLLENSFTVYAIERPTVSPTRRNGR